LEPEVPSLPLMAHKQLLHREHNTSKWLGSQRPEQPLIPQ
jgi:hypothetical protein